MGVDAKAEWNVLGFLDIDRPFITKVAGTRAHCPFDSRVDLVAWCQVYVKFLHRVSFGYLLERTEFIGSYGKRKVRSCPNVEGGMRPLLSSLVLPLPLNPGPPYLSASNTKISQ